VCECVVCMCVCVYVCMSVCVCVSVHVMILNGPKLEKKENTLGKIVDTGSDLMVMAAVLSRYLTRKKEGKLENKERELVRIICHVMAREVRSNYQKIKTASHPAIVGMSKAIMDNELKWLETGVTDYVAAAKVRGVPGGRKGGDGHRPEAVVGK